MEQQHRRRGRPPLTMPDPIPDSPANVARALMLGKPKKPNEWRYMQHHGVRERVPDTQPASLTRAERRRLHREARRGRLHDIASATCPTGHPEQAQDWMLHGTPPSECPRCGETPQFEVLPSEEQVH